MPSSSLSESDSGSATVSVTSSSEEDVSGKKDEDPNVTNSQENKMEERKSEENVKEEKENHTETAYSKNEDACAVSTVNKKKSAPNSDDDELVIGYTVETTEVGHAAPKEIGSNSSSPNGAHEDMESTPTPESVQVKKSSSEDKEIASEETVLRTPIAIEAPPVEPNGEVVEEPRKSVKEQIAHFKNLNIQETHGKPKPGTASAFATKQSNTTVNSAIAASAVAVIKPPEPPPIAIAKKEEIYKNPSPKPFGANANYFESETDDKSEERFTQAKTAANLQSPDRSTFDRPQPVDRPSEPSPQPKKFVIPKNITLTPPITFGMPYGNGNHSVKPLEPVPKEVSPSLYLGPDVLSRDARPPMMIRLRKPGPEAPWGFAVFGGVDYGCPPFISRVTLHSIGARAGLEVGDVIESICEAPVSGKMHSQIKAEILRAGNELDFVVIKQGIDKDMLAQRAPHILPSPGPLPPQSPRGSFSCRGGGGVYQKSPLTWSSASPSASYDKVTRTRSFRLLDEHLNAMSARSNSSAKPLTSRLSPARPVKISPTRVFHSESAPRANYTAGSTYQPMMSRTSNYGTINQSIYSPSAVQAVFSQSQPTAELSPNRTYFATPIGAGCRHSTSPTQVFYDTASRAPRTRSYSTSISASQQLYRYDPDLMTQYYGTQQTCYTRYPTHREHQQEQRMMQSSYQSTSDWSTAAPTSQMIFRPPASNYTSVQNSAQEYRRYDSQQHQQMQSYVPATNLRDQERWSTAGSVQTYNDGWV